MRIETKNTETQSIGMENVEIQSIETRQKLLPVSGMSI